MRILSFIGHKIHGRQNLKINFNEDLTFLIGINGSGKTTVVRTIHSLIAPNIPALAFLDFDSIELSVFNNNETITISATQSEEGLTLRTSKTKDALFLSKFEMPASEPPYKFNELFLDYYKTQVSIHSDHDVLKSIRELPTPMYLGIERRVQLERELPRVRYYKGMQKRNIFAGALLASLDDASELAATQFRQIQEKEDKLKDKLRNKLLLGNFEYVNANPSPGFKIPAKAERDAINKQRGNIREILLTLGLPEELISENVDQFFNKIEELIKKLPDKTPRDFASVGREITDTIVTWHFNQWQYNKAVKLIAQVNEFVEESKHLYAPINRFLFSVNSFFKDSGKTIEITRFGMSVIHNDGRYMDLSSLSSGEQQLLVLLTHLAFNPSAELANVLVIDEPELSLHLAWQEKFADALLAANPKTQFILATHSPSIILDRAEKCIELTAE